jgi:hypothetical protein
MITTAPDELKDNLVEQQLSTLMRAGGQAVICSGVVAA